MKHPVPYAVGVSAVLLVLAIPFLNFNPGTIDDRVVPDDVSSRATTDQIRENFASREADALQVLAEDASLETDADAIDALRQASSPRCPGVARVDAGDRLLPPGRRRGGAVSRPPT